MQTMQKKTYIVVMLLCKLYTVHMCVHCANGLSVLLVTRGVQLKANGFIMKQS